MNSKRSEDIHYLILAGGRGTRSENPNVAKLLQKIAPKKSILDLIVDNFKSGPPSRITFLISHLGSSIESELDNVRRTLSGWSVDYIYDQEHNLGTAIPIDNAVQRSGYEYFAVIFGDTACSVNFRVLLDQWDCSKYDAAVVVHPNLHPWDSDKIEVGQDGEFLKFFSKSVEVKEPKSILRSISGMLFFKGSEYLKINTFEKDIVNKIIKGFPESRITTINSSYYQKDSGTISRIQEIRKDYKDGALNRRGAFLRSAIFLDRDGTLISDKPSGRIFISAQELWLDSIDAIKRANSAGIPIFLVTNQPGVAKGFLGMCDVLRVEAELENILVKKEAFLDDFRFCPHHPELGFRGEVKDLKIACTCRKPGIGMLTDLSKKHGVDLLSSFMIGDSEIDRLTAMNAQMTYIFADYETKHSLAAAINMSIDTIINAY